MNAVGVIAPQAPSDTGVYVNLDLTIGSGDIVSVTESTLTLETPSGRTERIPLDRLHGLGLPLPPPTPEPLEGRYFVRLIDGQRLAVDLGHSTDPDTIAGSAPGIGEVVIPVERIQAISVMPLSYSELPLDSDRVTLLNGDVLTGFVVSLGHEIAIESEAGLITRIDIERARSVQLANPAAKPDNEAVYVFDSAGFVLIAETFNADITGALTLQTDAFALGAESNGEGRLTYEPDSVGFAGLMVHRTSDRIVDLDELSQAPAVPTGGRRWAPEPELTAAVTPPRFPDLFMPAPASVRYELPRGAVSFAAGVAHRGGAWTNCVASVLAQQPDGTTVQLGELAIDASTHPGETIGTIRADLPADTVAIVFEVDPGVYGAVQDAVVFVKPRIRVRD